LKNHKPRRGGRNGTFRKEKGAKRKLRFAPFSAAAKGTFAVPRRAFGAVKKADL